MQDLTVKRIRRAPIVIFIGLLVMQLALALLSYSLVNKTTVVTVRVKHLSKNIYNRVELGENSFETGGVGDLRWKVKSFKEAFIQIIW